MKHLIKFLFHQYSTLNGHSTFQIPSCECYSFAVMV